MNRRRQVRRRTVLTALARAVAAPPIGLVGKGRLKDRAMNRLEAAYADELERRRLVREIAWWDFEAVKLRLADSTFYTPDFIVMGVGGEIEFHETKGFWEEDARIKIKVAARQFPFRFLGIRQASRRNGGGWQVEAFS